MASRRTLRVLLIVGAILVAVGVGAILYGNTPASVSETDPIPAGWFNFNEFSWSVLAGGTVQGTFSEINGTPVNVLVYNDADFNSFYNGANLTALYNVTAASGTISLSVSGFNTYHVVFQHAAGYENTNQTVNVNLTATGADPTFTLGGILALVVAALLIVVAIRKSKQAAAPSGVLESRATIPGPSAPPVGPDTSTSAGGVYRVPPPLPGDASSPPTAAPSLGVPPPASTDPTKTPVGTILVTVQNGSAADASLDLVVNGVAVTSLTVPAGQSVQTSVNARLSSPFGSTVVVEAVLAGGRRARQAVFVGAGGTAPVSLRVG